MRIRGLQFFVLAAVVGSGVLTPAARGGPFDAEAFGRLSEKDRLSFVLEQLDARDRKLQNFSYEMEEVHTNIALDGGKRRFMYSSHYTVRRIGEKRWMHVVESEYYVPNGKTREDALLNWDGKSARSLSSPPYYGVPYPKCSIRPQENGNFHQRKYNELLGFEATIEVEKKGVPLAEWVRRAMRHPEESVSISSEQLNGTPVIRLKARVGAHERNILLDPARGYMVVRFERDYRVGKKGYNHSVEEVLAAREIEGVWVPTTCFARNGTSAAQEETEITYDVKEFTIGTVKEGDTDIQFPVGSEVLDAVYKISYFIEGEKKYRLVPVSDGHKVYLPTQRVVDHVDADTSKLYREQERRDSDPLY